MSKNTNPDYNRLIHPVKITIWRFGGAIQQTGDPLTPQSALPTPTEQFQLPKLLKEIPEEEGLLISVCLSLVQVQRKERQQ
ncbi:16659_t:CDS:2 [Entrophospora sp. SA101]|nr:16659_t:CDS:2 [Entrophospora sp. SA101]